VPPEQLHLQPQRPPDPAAEPPPPAPDHGTTA
jgi:hypothetical protein